MSLLFGLKARSSVPTYSGKPIQRRPMPSRSVIEYTCERCTRSWYVDAKDASPQMQLELTLLLSPTDKMSVEFKCLCDGCQGTVKALAAQIAKVMKKSAPVRGAKKKPSAEDKPPTPGTATEPPATGAQLPVASVKAANAASTPAASPSAASSAPARPPSTRV